MADLVVSLAGIELRNPVIAAAGTCGYVDELADVLDLREIGGAVTKSITPEPREGNPPWRLIDLPNAGGMLNAIGLANVGLEKFQSTKMPALATGASTKTKVFVSIAGARVSDYVKVAAAVDTADHIPAVELNVSCPNTDDGQQIGEDPHLLATLVSEVRNVLRNTKLFVKLSPNVGDIVAIAEQAVAAGADGLTLINTIAAMAFDPDSRTPRLSRGQGGLSGPAIHPIAVRMVFDVYRSVARDAKVPIIGLGGVLNWRDAAEFILAGATAVGMGTALLVDPTLPRKVVRGLDAWVSKQKCGSIRDLIGAAHAS